jgi:hypothetical protein
MERRPGLTEGVSAGRLTRRSTSFLIMVACRSTDVAMRGPPQSPTHTSVTALACFACARFRRPDDRTPFRSTGPDTGLAHVRAALWGRPRSDRSLVATATAELASQWTPPPTVKDHCIGVSAGLTH